MTTQGVGSRVTTFYTAPSELHSAGHRLATSEECNCKMSNDTVHGKQETSEGVAEMLIEQNGTDSNPLRDPSKQTNLVRWLESWVNAFHFTNASSNYGWLVGSIEEKFRFRCMQDAMQESESWRPEPCTVKAAIRLCAEFTKRKANNMTIAPNPPPSMPLEERTFDRKTLIAEAIKDVRRETMDFLIVEFLAALSKLPKLDRSTKKNVIEYIGWELWLETKGSGGRGEKFASGTWTSILCALLDHKHLQFKFTAFNTEQTKGLYHFVLITIGAIVRMDSVKLLKKWLRRHSGDYMMYLVQGTHGSLELSLSLHSHTL